MGMPGQITVTFAILESPFKTEGVFYLEKALR